MLALALIVAAGVALFVLSLTIGANRLPSDEVWRVLWHPDDSTASTIVWGQRFPRTLVGAVAGVAFGVAGALIQALTRNPLADPGVLGVNAGAWFAVTVGIGVFGVTAMSGYMWFAFVGAAVATVLVYVIGSAGRGTASPVTLVLAGVALGAVLGAFATFLALMDPYTFRDMQAWGLGSTVRATLGDLSAVAPLVAVGVVIAMLLGGALNSISLGDELAASLGTDVTRARVFGIIAVTLLAGGGTALTGGLTFVGLMVPHIVRWFVGPDQRWILLFSALCAPLLVVSADILGRVVLPSGEVQAGIVTAVIGAPVLIAMVRRRRVSGL